MLHVCCTITKQRADSLPCIKYRCSAWYRPSVFFSTTTPKSPQKRRHVRLRRLLRHFIQCCSACLHSTALKALHAPIQLVLCTAKVFLNQGQLFWEDYAAYRDEMFWKPPQTIVKWHVCRLYTVLCPVVPDSQISCLPTPANGKILGACSRMVICLENMY